MLNTAPNLAAPDATYAALAGLHRGLSAADSRLVDARLILLLANHVGDAVLQAAMDRAVQGVRREPVP